MSDLVNAQLFERAAEMIDYFEGKLPAKAIEQALDNQDLEALYVLVCTAESLATQQEMEYADVF